MVLEHLVYNVYRVRLLHTIYCTVPLGTNIFWFHQWLVDSISNADFEEPIIDSVPIILANPVSRDCNDERDGADWSSQISWSRMKHVLGLFPGPQSAMSGYYEKVNSVEWPIDCRLAWWSTIKVDFVKRTHFQWLQSRGRSTTDWPTRTVIYPGEVQICKCLSLLRMWSWT